MLPAVLILKGEWGEVGAGRHREEKGVALAPLQGTASVGAGRGSGPGRATETGGGVAHARHTGDAPGLHGDTAHPLSLLRGRRTDGMKRRKRGGKRR